MTRQSPYFMRDQARHRVARIMRGHGRAAVPASPVWPVVAVIAALTFINVLASMPQP